MTIEDNVINEIFKNLENKSNYKKRYSEIKNSMKKINLKRRV